jgi:hypothetical protein
LYQRRQEKTTFTVIFTYLPEAVGREGRDRDWKGKGKGTGKIDGKKGIERDWKDGREKEIGKRE